MRNLYNKQLKEICHKCIVTAKVKHNLTQAQMAELLVMDIRSYADIDSGKSSCGLLTFVLYLLYLCPDIDGLIDEIRISFESVKNNVA